MDEPPPAIPTLPERFTAVERLGAGSQAVTVAAHDEQRGRDVAIKVLELGQVHDWKAFERFERECSVLESLDHPGVPTVLEQLHDEARGQHLLVMERVPGRSLADDLRSGRRRSEAQLLDLLRQLLDLLEYLHSLHPPVIHRDIKPSNVIVRPDGRPVLVDFGGVAKVFRPEGASTVVGTFGYMAPEQLYARVSPGTDLYGLGATLAAVAAGEDAERLPRRGLAVDLSEAIQPGILRSVLEAMLEPDPDLRPGSVAEVRALLEPGGAEISPALRRRSKVSSPVPSSSTELAVPRRASVLARMGPRHKTIVIAYFWVAIGLGVMTRAVFLTVALLLLSPLLVLVFLDKGHDSP
ncbi:MAG: serine/threonine protein kinase [Myxococcales bacterium]|nr:serine/threonine protein kinase [Myxococcales bacterium]